jgi:RNA polymerase sigma-70 factor (ECF subfamily)
MAASPDIELALAQAPGLPLPVLAPRRSYGTVRVSTFRSFDTPTMAEARPLAGDRAQFEAAVRPVVSRLYRFCLGLTGDHDQADDLFQNTLLKAYLNAASFEGRSDLLVWICGIARNEYLEARRTEARRRGIFDRFIDACASALGLEREDDTSPTPEASAIMNENADMLLACLQKIPEEYRAVLVLCDIEELGYDRAAEILGVPKGTVKSRHARGRARLREVYENMSAQSAVAAREEST